MGLVQKGDSCSFLHSHASGNRETSAEEVKNTGVSSLKTAVNNERRRKGKEQASSSVPTGKGQTDDKRSTSLEARPATGAKIPCPWEGGGGQDVKDRRVIFGILPCVVVVSLETDASMAIIACIHMLTARSQSESTQGAVAILKEKKVQGWVSQNSDPKKSILRKAGQTRLDASAGHAKKFSGRTLYEIPIRERKGPSRGVIQKGEPHERNPCAPKFEERTPEETSRQEECARKAAWNLARNIYKLKNVDKATFYIPGQWKLKAPVLVSQNRKNVCLWLIRELQCACWARRF